MSEKKRINLKIEAKDFGPISAGTIILKPLTLFIGPNNSGKSYAAMLIHSIFESLTPTLTKGLPRFARQHFMFGYIDSNSLLKQLPELKEVIKKIIDDLKQKKEADFPEQALEKITNKIYEEIYEKRLSDEIIRSYACPLRELIRIGKSSFELGINFNSYHIGLLFESTRIKIKEYPQGVLKIKFKLIDSRRLVEVLEEKNEILIGKIWESEEKNENFVHLLCNITLEFCASKILKYVARQCYYLPAARSGILQGHRALAASIIRKVPYAGIEKLPEIPKFSGVVSDFISSILTLPDEKGPLYKFAQDFEKDLIKGEIVVRTLDEYLGPEIKYNFKGAEIPLHRASSTVSELAPLFLYLKYGIEPDTVLIIEEPEAHLHPQNQRILAKYLVKMIRRGVNIIITTHSEYLLEQLNNFILLSKIEPKERVEKYKYSEEDFLVPGEVSAYVFEYDKSSSGYKINEIEITDKEGISQEEFLKINEALYEETFKLQKYLSVEK